MIGFYRKAFALTLMLLFSHASWSLESQIEEKNIFIKQQLGLINSTDVKSHSSVAKALQNKGVQNPEIYQRIAELIQTYVVLDTSSLEYKTISWLVKGLAASGDEQYRPLIQQLSKTGKGRVDNHAKKSLKILDKAIELNPIWANEDLYTGSESWQAVRDANIVTFSNRNRMKKRIAEVAIVENKYDAFVFDAMHSLISSDFQIESHDRQNIDTYAYMLKAMTYYPTPEYIDLIKKASSSAGDKKLRRYATGYLKANKKKFARIEETKQRIFENSQNYKGEKFGSVEVVLSEPENFGPEKKQALRQWRLLKKRLKT